MGNPPRSRPKATNSGTALAPKARPWGITHKGMGFCPRNRGGSPTSTMGDHPKLDGRKWLKFGESDSDQNRLTFLLTNLTIILTGKEKLIANNEMSRPNRPTRFCRRRFDTKPHRPVSVRTTELASEGARQDLRCENSEYSHRHIAPPGLVSGPWSCKTHHGGGLMPFCP